ncbi:PqqD family protein [Cytobacillus praedii]|jgi:Coenzyme PQQ synthesis protein D (PqqD)|uniref:PqqD family protein n=1 Tax=Cytobacillus praedii TaxID=1742358 RepID=UPI002E1FBA41|nr:PqqD family protein [Cytobacillus praedii]
MKPTRDIFVQYRVINGVKYIMKNYKVFQLDEVGELIWDSLDGQTTLDEIAEKIAKLYKVDQSIILHDVAVFIKEMSQNELIEI